MVTVKQRVYCTVKLTFTEEKFPVWKFNGRKSLKKIILQVRSYKGWPF